MTQAQAGIQFEIPQVTEKVNKQLEGVLSKILSYQFEMHSESVPGSNTDWGNVTTKLKVEFKSPTGQELEEIIDVQGFVGAELVGQIVQYEDRTKETTTYFNPKGRENDPSYRQGKKETERIQILSPKDARLPTYTSVQTSQFTI